MQHHLPLVAGSGNWNCLDKERFSWRTITVFHQHHLYFLESSKPLSLLSNSQVSTQIHETRTWCQRGAELWMVPRAGPLSTPTLSFPSLPLLWLLLLPSEFYRTTFPAASLPLSTPLSLRKGQGETMHPQP